MSAKFLLLFIDVDLCSSSMLMLVRPAYALVAQLRLFFSFHSILSLTVPLQLVLIYVAAVTVSLVFHLGWIGINGSELIITDLVQGYS